MPTLVRLLTVIAVIAAVIYAIMAALVFFVEPTPRQVTIEVPLRQIGTTQPAGGAAPATGDAASAAGDPER